LISIDRNVMTLQVYCFRIYSLPLNFSDNLWLLHLRLQNFRELHPSRHLISLYQYLVVE